MIDLGSSCFTSDHLSSYVQSRSYRAPEVILGLPYDQKIDIWSFGCILAELLTGSVLFQVSKQATPLHMPANGIVWQLSCNPVITLDCTFDEESVSSSVNA